MHYITRLFTFSAAHRIEGHPKCGRLHGHNYEVDVFIGSDTLRDGMVLDFAELDRIVKPIIDSLDHRYICSDFDTSDHIRWACDESEYIQLPIKQTTAEQLAKWLYLAITKALTDNGLIFDNNDPFSISPLMLVHMVRVRETPRNVAIYMPHGESETDEL